MWNQLMQDDAVMAQAAAELRRSSYTALRQIECHVRDGVLTLTGRVSSYYEKQIAQTLVQFRLPNVKIQNELQVPFHLFDEPAVVDADELVLV